MTRTGDLPFFLLYLLPLNASMCVFFHLFIHLFRICICAHVSTLMRCLRCWFACPPSHARFAGVVLLVKVTESALIDLCPAFSFICLVVCTQPLSSGAFYSNECRGANATFNRPTSKIISSPFCIWEEETPQVCTKLGGITLMPPTSSLNGSCCDTAYRQQYVKRHQHNKLAA